jgi:hypothetical protein
MNEITCTTCGYSLRGLTVESRCPECGAPIAESLRKPGPTQTSGKAIASMVLGILSVAGCFAYGIPGPLLGLPAVILGFMAKSDVANGKDSPDSNGYALTGIICGFIGLIPGLIIMVLFGLAVLPRLP